MHFFLLFLKNPDIKHIDVNIQLSVGKTHFKLKILVSLYVC